MNKYELTVILKSKEDTEALKENVKKILDKYNVKIESEDQWGVRKLAYEIKKEKEGFYIFFTLTSPPEAITEIIKDFRLNINILRYFFIKLKQSKSA